MKKNVHNTKTAIQQLVEYLKLDPNNEALKNTLTQLMYVERSQIIDAFNEGVKYGQSILPPFDYPDLRYYNYTYKGSDTN